MENNPEQPLAIPTTTEGIAIHLGYISRNLAELNKKMDAVQNSTVGREEFASPLKADEDHEARIRLLETAVTDIRSSMRTWFIAGGIILSLLEIALRFFLK